MELVERQKLKVAVLRVSPRPWGGRAFGVDEEGREIWLKTRSPGMPLGMANRMTAAIATQVRHSQDRLCVIEIESQQILKVTGQAPDVYMKRAIEAFRAYDLMRRLGHST